MVASDAPSFDVSIRLLDVAPDGSASLILSDHLRVEATPQTPMVVPFDMSLMRHQLGRRTPGGCHGRRL